MTFNFRSLFSLFVLFSLAVFFVFFIWKDWRVTEGDFPLGSLCATMCRLFTAPFSFFLFFYLDSFI